MDWVGIPSKTRGSIQLTEKTKQMNKNERRLSIIKFLVGNRGLDPLLHVKNKREVLAISLFSESLTDAVTNWRTLYKHYFSILVRSPRKANRDLYKIILNGKSSTYRSSKSHGGPVLKWDSPLNFRFQNEHRRGLGGIKIRQAVKYGTTQGTEEKLLGPASVLTFRDLKGLMADKDPFNYDT